ncbi:MAG: hypothetical protein AVO38_03630 [delta proteobacterium ML8_D]|nr:MAG: hypothetical protein AVO38_03630 [delta proteobacterium ML8_D]
MTDQKSLHTRTHTEQGYFSCKTKSEVNFLVLPYFNLDRTNDSDRCIEFREIQQRGNETQEIAWEVIPHPDFGLPKDFDRRLHRAVEYSLSNFPRPIVNPVPLPSYRELARIMGQNCSGQFIERIRKGLTTMMMTAIVSERSYYNKYRQFWVTGKFHLYEKIIFKGEPLDDGKTSTRNYVCFNRDYLDNLNALYVRPLDFDYLRSLKPVAARLYELLGVKFFGHRKHIQYKYSTLCKLLPLKQQKSFSRSRQQLEGAHKELRKTGFLGRHEWISINGVKNDWYVRYVPGSRFFDEMRALEQKPEEEREPVHVVEEMTCGQDAPAVDDCISLDMSYDPDPAWIEFAKVVQAHREFDLQDADHEWFAHRVVDKFSWQGLNLLEEVRNWEDWLSIEHRKKISGKAHKFPRSNFKGSFLNWLKHSIRSDAAVSSFSQAEEHATSGRKGWDLPSDYPIDVM